MYSLAVLVAIIFLIAVFAGPISFALTFIPGDGTNRKMIRRAPILVLTFMGLVVCTQLIIVSVPLLGKIVALFGLATTYLALRREFFRDFTIRNALRRRGIGGGSSRGNDGHGPAGQH